VFHPVILAGGLVTNLLKLALLGSSWVMYVLIALSVISIGMMIERFLYFRKNAGDGEAIAEKVVAFVDRGDISGAEAELAGDRSIEAQVIRSAIKWAPGGPDSFEDAVAAEFARRKKYVERSSNFLGTLGSNAPFIGLFGTVIGVIEAFAHLGAGTDKDAMANVMSGIAEALIATGVGLFVAIPAVVAYNVFQKKLADIEDNLQSITKSVTALLKALAVSPVAAHRAVRETPGEKKNDDADGERHSAVA
jgi:biopolymer transport protein ExbB/biopolymer transport protein TolQ